MQIVLFWFVILENNIDKNEKEDNYAKHQKTDAPVLPRLHLRLFELRKENVLRTPWVKKRNVRLQDARMRQRSQRKNPPSQRATRQ